MFDAKVLLKDYHLSFLKKKYCSPTRETRLKLHQTWQTQSVLTKTCLYENGLLDDLPGSKGSPINANGDLV